MTIGYRKPRLLRPDDSLDEFECRSPEQTLWLRDHARQADASGTAKVMIVTEAGSQTVVAYYAWAMANISVDDAPDRVRKGAGRYPQPIALLARLGVDIDHEGNGLGAGLLQDVISRVAEFGTQISCRGLLVHAENEDARDFYLHLLPGFESSPTDPLHLVLLMKDIHHALKG